MTLGEFVYEVGEVFLHWGIRWGLQLAFSVGFGFGLAYGIVQVVKRW